MAIERNKAQHCMKIRDRETKKTGVINNRGPNQIVERYVRSVTAETQTESLVVSVALLVKAISPRVKLVKQQAYWNCCY
jgi:hypothetical protein